MLSGYSVVKLVIGSCVFLGGCAHEAGLGLREPRAAALGIAEEGRPLAVIVLPDEPGDTEELAAAELQKYIQKITGAELPIKPERDAGDRAFLSVGRTRLAAGARERLAGKPVDAFIVERVENGILLAGAGESARSPGTLFAVYDFLERELGCRWLGRGELWEHVPEQAVLSVSPADRLESPVFLYRQCKLRDSQLWSAKNKANMGANHIFPFDFFTDRVLGRDQPPFDVPGWSGWHSGPRSLFPVAGRHYDSELRRQTLATTPEWLSLNRDGSRRPAWLCNSNPELNDLLAERISQMFREQPHTDYIELGEGDGYAPCQCDRCLEAEAEGGMAYETHRGIYAYRWRLWENRVAALLAETDPDKKLMGVAYGGGQEPLDPDLIRPADNVMIEYATWANCRAHGYEHMIEDDTRLPEAASHELSRDWMKRWIAQTPGGVMMTEYLNRNSMQHLTAPIPRRYVRDMRYLRDMGFVGYRSIIGPQWGGFFTINKYAALRSAWNPDLDEDELVRDYCDHAFHEASKHIQAFIKAVEETVERSGCCHCRIVAWTTDIAGMKKARRHLDAAHKAAEGNEIVQKRLLDWELHFQYAALAGPAIFNIVRGGYQENDADMVRKGIELMKIARDYGEEMRAEYGDVVSRRVSVALAVPVRYLREDGFARRRLAALEEAEEE